ncbi:MAG: (deoxy)nucleoside triphosphate pyrophosphohydrolase [Thermoguttaceae bacterium]
MAVAVVQHDGRVLIGRRSPGTPLAGLWEFPGGQVQPHETPQQAVTRECREETGLEVRVGQQMLEAVHRYRHGVVRLWFFAAEPVDPTQAPAPPFRWVPIAGLRAYRFPAANAAVVERLLRESGPKGGEAAAI